jgi:hypothetical protein
MDKMHNVGSVRVDNTFLYLTVDGQSYRIRWDSCSSRLAKATLRQRRRLEVSPSGYGIHWPEIDEDLAITPLLQRAEIVVTEEQLVVSQPISAGAPA